ncbi:hypothetical protein G3N55_08790 [Dissulfurirhabdus thermomarina]|uniref:Uncharacterized protein n=1 Tax=Dissulfurirhabdus thermomarina TaxID=1765737 RepID=A0A6N9TWS3_DISTH|nr:hypothetical protein [Dissulfurirhabdus thermomarina]NDY42936.1 hypothetical protein [Dissulfurirhabdus thermomarina]
MRFRDPKTPTGYRMEVLLRPDTLPKMRRLLEIVDGRIVAEDHAGDHVRLVVEKGPPEAARDR